ncbi:MAG: hypothetical protein P8K66_11055 [Planctomycetota bacterium]|nr:hypothetical protein [Planctomycetota bacterium]
MTEFISACQGTLPDLLNFPWAKIHWRNASMNARRLQKWFHGDSEQDSDTLTPKRPEGSPVLLHNEKEGQGCFGWLTLHEDPQAANETEKACDEILEHLNQTLGYRQHRYHSRIRIPQEGKELLGTSAALPALLEWIQRELEIKPASEKRCSWGRCLGSGAWNSSKKILSHVKAEGLNKKISAAISQGYQTLFVVSGQPYQRIGTENLEIIEVSENPVDAVFDILQSVPVKEALILEPHKFESLLLAIRKRFLLATDRYQTTLPDLVEHIQAIAKKSAELNAIYCMATAIKAGKKLFHGDPGALADIKEVHRILPDTKFTHSESCSWFRTEWLPNTGEALVDNIQWNDSDWSTYLESKKRWNDFVQPWDTAGLFESMKAENQESFRYLFAARIEPDPRKAKDLLMKTVDSRLRFQHDWDSIFSFNHQREDTSPGRQANLLAEILWGQRLMECRFQCEPGELNEIGERIIPAVEKLGLEQNNSFDRLAGWTLAYWKGDISSMDTLTCALIESNHEIGNLEYSDSWLAERVFFTESIQFEKIHQLLEIPNLQEEKHEESMIKRLLRRRRQGLLILNQNQKLPPDPDLPEAFQIQNPRTFYLACPY